MNALTIVPVVSSRCYCHALVFIHHLVNHVISISILVHTGDIKEARRRWEITKHWREAEGVNGILNEPQPFYHLMYVVVLATFEWIFWLNCDHFFAFLLVWWICEWSSSLCIAHCV